MGVTDLNLNVLRNWDFFPELLIMYSSKLVFAQLMEHLPLHTFHRCVLRYPSKYPTKTFSHLDQFLCLAFAQLTYERACATSKPVCALTKPSCKRIHHKTITR